MLYTKIFLGLLFELTLQADGYSDSKRISPSASYRLLGSPGIRFMGQCNITYAWLIPPTTATLDAYGHALACNRIGLKNGRILQDDDPVDSTPMRAEVLHTKHKDNTATMVDLIHLDTLLRADPRGNGRFVSESGNQLADEDRYFFLADRIDDFNVMVLFRTNQPLKIELINPYSADQLFTPQHVLCYRKQCPVVRSNNTADNSIAPSAKSVNSQHLMSMSLVRAERQNRELYMQLVISRVACALLSVLCIVFAVAALTLCVKLRKSKSFFHHKPHPSQLSICHDPHPSPSYFQPNGKLAVGQPSPAYLADPGRVHAMQSDNTSVTNFVMTASNLSDCGVATGLHGAPLSYTTVNSPYGQFAAYPVPAGCGSLYNENTGLLAYVPVNSRAVVLPYQNGSASPAPSHNSLGEAKMNITRSGSLGRYSVTNAGSVEAGRRRILRVNRPIIVGKTNDGQLLTNHGLDQMKHNCQNDVIDTNEASDLERKLHDEHHPNDLHSFQSNQPQPIHRYPSEHLSNYGTANTPCGSINGDRTSLLSNNLGHENCVSLVRKPALANT